MVLHKGKDGFIGEGLTVESVMNGRRVVNNGEFGVDENLKGLTKEDYTKAYRVLTQLKSHIMDNGEYTVDRQPLGLVVGSGKEGVTCVAFIGYDEGSAGSVRLNYTTDTFFALELATILANFRGIVGKDELTERQEELKETIQEELKEAEVFGDELEYHEQEPDEASVVSALEEVFSGSDKLESEHVPALQDFGYNNTSESRVKNEIKEKIALFGDKLEAHELLTGKYTKEELVSVLNDLLAVNEDVLTKSYPFVLGDALYRYLKEVMEVLSEAVSSTHVEFSKNEISWVCNSGMNIFSVASRSTTNSQEDNMLDNEGVGVVVNHRSPSYAVIRKLFNALSSNIRFKELRVETTFYGQPDESFNSMDELDDSYFDTATFTQELPEEVQGTDVGVEDSQVLDLEDEAEQAEAEGTLFLTDKEARDGEYFDWYMQQAGEWAKGDNKYKAIKETLSKIANDHSDYIRGITFHNVKGSGDNEASVDWVINKNTYTMAVTAKATMVNELKTMYDMVVAYDPEYPATLGALILEELCLVMGNDWV